MINSVLGKPRFAGGIALAAALLIGGASAPAAASVTSSTDLGVIASGTIVNISGAVSPSNAGAAIGTGDIYSFDDYTTSFGTVTGAGGDSSFAIDYTFKVSGTNTALASAGQVSDNGFTTFSLSLLQGSTVLATQSDLSGSFSSSLGLSYSNLLPNTPYTLVIGGTLSPSTTGAGISAQISAVPLPASAVLFGSVLMGLVGITFMRRRDLGLLGVAATLAVGLAGTASATTVEPEVTVAVPSADKSFSYYATDASYKAVAEEIAAPSVKTGSVSGATGSIDYIFGFTLAKPESFRSTLTGLSSGTTLALYKGPLGAGSLVESGTVGSTINESLAAVSLSANQQYYVSVITSAANVLSSKGAQYNGTVFLSAVPLPPAAALLLSGLAGITGFGALRRKTGFNA